MRKDHAVALPRAVGWIGVASAVMMMAGCSKASSRSGPPAPAECEALRDHLVAAKVETVIAEAKAAGTPMTPEAIEEGRAYVRKGYGPVFIDGCLRTPRPEFECLMKIKTRADIDACSK